MSGRLNHFFSQLGALEGEIDLLELFKLNATKQSFKTLGYNVSEIERLFVPLLIYRVAGVCKRVTRHTILSWTRFSAGSSRTLLLLRWIW